MPDYQQFREDFAAFVGPDVFVKFLRAGVSENHLRFWQEQHWNRFLAAQPGYNLSFAELREALQICPVHGDDLQTEMVKASPGHVDYAPSYGEILQRIFPYASLDRIYHWNIREPTEITILFCRKCRAAYWEYQRNFFRRISDETYRFQRSMLTRRVELEDYLTFNGQVDPAGFDERTQGRLQQRRDDVAELMQPGDELWEWHEPPPASRIGGLVLMRGEQAIVAWGDYKP